MDLNKYVSQAKTSRFGLFKLNVGLAYIVPFNKPHRIRIQEIGDDFVKTRIPYRRRNMNHIKGIHACGLATAAEFASGFLLLSKLGTTDYRLIMESIEMKYHYQAKCDVTATFSATANWIDETIKMPLQNADAVLVKCEIRLDDVKGNHVATGYTNWQIKAWSKVKTQL